MQIFVLEEGECQGNQGSMHHFFAREGTLDAQTMHLLSLHYGGGGGILPFLPPHPPLYQSHALQVVKYGSWG